MNGLFIVPTDFQSLLKKGVIDKLLEQDEDGILETVITIHPFAKENDDFELSPDYRMAEYSQSDYSK